MAIARRRLRATPSLGVFNRAGSVPARKTRTAPPGAGAKVCREAALGSASKASHLGCHGTRYVRYGRGW